MKRIFKNWPWFLVLFGLAASIGLSAQSWDTSGSGQFSVTERGAVFHFFYERFLPSGQFFKNPTLLLFRGEQAS